LERYFKSKAPAKINLYLDVGKIRKDGYHEITTIYQSIRLSDTLFFKVIKNGIEIECDNKDIPLNEDNLIYKSAKEFFNFTKIKKGIKVLIKKRIPAKGGLGGGSSDAAVTLFALNKIFKKNLTLNQLTAIGEKIGSDVPFFLYGGTALGYGKGEKIIPLKDFNRLYLIVGFPGKGISTREAYKEIDRVLTGNISRLKIIEPVRKYLTGDFRKEDMFNRFEEVVKNSEILEYRDNLIKSGAEKVMLCGSGSTWFGIYSDRTKLKSAFERLSAQGNWAATSTLKRREFLRFITPTNVKKESIR